MTRVNLVKNVNPGCMHVCDVCNKRFRKKKMLEYHNCKGVK